MTLYQVIDGAEITRHFFLAPQYVFICQTSVFHICKNIIIFIDAFFIKNNLINNFVLNLIDLQFMTKHLYYTIYTVHKKYNTKYNTKYKNTHKRTGTYTSALNIMSVCHQIFLIIIFNKNNKTY